MIYRMKRPVFRGIAALFMVAASSLVACTAPPVSPVQIEQKATGTLQGRVAIGPLQPVVRADEPTPVVPPEVYAARQIVIYTADGQTQITRVPIGPDGTYQVALRAGSYVVDINRGGMDSSKDLPANVQIVAGQTTTLDVEIDTGIR